MKEKKTQRQRIGKRIQTSVIINKSYLKRGQDNNEFNSEEWGPIKNKMLTETIILAKIAVVNNCIMISVTVSNINECNS